MEKLLKKIASIINRHPLLYYIRYILISKNYKGKSVDKIGLFQDFNSLEAIPQLYFSINSKIAIDNSLDELDKAIEILNPRAAIKRIGYRKALELTERQYDSAAKGRRTKGY